MSGYTHQGQKKPLCQRFTTGQCPFGDKCKHDHPDNLRPDVLDTSGWAPPAGETCLRCAEEALPCDKGSRDADERDPCSECRWFAGKGAKCVKQSKTMNDMQWYKFMSRQAQGFDLPAFRARDEMVMSHSKRPAKIPEQMPVGELKPGWEGETRDQLLAKPDLLTEDIRAHPRKYFKCPGLSKTVESAQAKNRVIPEQLGQPEFAKRKAEGTVHDRHKEPEVAAAVPSPALANFPPALETRPSLAGLGGSYPATTMTWSYIEKAWKTEWSSVLRPGKHAVSSVAPLDFRPAPHAQSGDAISATWSYITRRWKITWADDCSMESSCLGESKKSSSGAGQKRSREQEQPASRTGPVVDAPPVAQTIPQLPSQPLQGAPAVESQEPADEHRDKKPRRPDVTGLEAPSDDDERFGESDGDDEME